MNRRRVIVNSVLGVAVIGVGLGGYLSVSQADQSKTAVARTVTVTRGNLTSTVTATGNAEAVTSIGVELEGSAGVVRKIYVKEGQKVAKGQKLLEIDQTSAKEALKTAKNGLRSAEASYETTTQGQTAAELAQSNASIASAQTSLKNARTGLSQAKASYSLDKKQQAGLVSIAEDGVRAAEDQQDDDADALSAARKKLASDQAAGDSTAVTADQATISSLTNAASSDATGITAAQKTLTQARQSRDSTLLKDKQAVQTQTGQVASAADALDSQVAAANVAAQPARDGAVKSAQVQIDNAKVAVQQAQDTLDDTVLRAPAAGTVSGVSAVKGQSSSSSGSSSTGSSSTGSSSSSTSTSSTSSTSSSSSSGLVTLTDLDRKQVVASVAEADVSKVKVGEKVSVAFAATGTTVAGTVTAIDTDDTVTNNVVTYGVTVTLDGNTSSVRVGQSASMTITTGTATGVLVAPSSAITTVGDRSTVTRRADGADSTVVVQTGLVGATGTEITSGVSAGDVLVVPTTSTASSTSTSSAGRTGLGGVTGGGPR